ncbi:DUF448 domain-containing protein [Rhizorhabdus wittichii]|uniref:DUF448 domain-containing protein n=1 Tax=Rhizorhabdus wittichii TaxID=160791 RepID=UPI00030902BC|nr:DUF448 domain-containing protein [Rhizorhabdus wittichii]
MANDEQRHAVAPVSGPAPDTGRPGKHVPERKCILSGAHGARPELIRLALAPDGSVLPDLRAKAPGRGAWIGVDRAALETAIAKGKLKGALARAFKTGDITIPADLPERIEQGLRRAALDRLGLELRGGAVLTGSDRIAEGARRGQVQLLLHAADASEDGNRKLDQALRVGLDAEGSDLRGVVIPADRTILSMALGRDNVVHIGVTVPAAAARVADALGRWCGFIGRSESASALRNRSAGSIGATEI